jgi:hypothetical protein
MKALGGPASHGLQDKLDDSFPGLSLMLLSFCLSSWSEHNLQEYIWLMGDGGSWHLNTHSVSHLVTLISL